MNLAVRFYASLIFVSIYSIDYTCTDLRLRRVTDFVSRGNMQPRENRKKRILAFRGRYSAGVLDNYHRLSARRAVRREISPVINI